MNLTNNYQCSFNNTIKDNALKNPADFELKLVELPSLSGFNKLPISNDTIVEDEIKILIQKDDNYITFLVNPKSKDVKVAFYLYKDDKRIDTQWYSKNFTYKIDKKKYGKGKYKVRYFIVSDSVENSAKSKKKETGYSKVIEVK